MRSFALAVPCLLAAPWSGLAEAPVIDHAPVKCLVAGRYPRLDATFAPLPVARARTYFRPQGVPSWYYVDMAPETKGAPGYAGVLPRPTRKLVGQKVEYYVEASNPAFESARTLEHDPLVVTRPEECGEHPVAAFASGPPLAVFPSLPAGFAVAGGVPAASVLAVVGGGAAAAGVVVATRDDAPSLPPATTQPSSPPAPPSAPTPTPPTAPPATGGLEISCRAQPQQGVAPLRVLFAATASGGTGSHDFTWTFGDGETSHQVTPGHTYAHPGTFQAEVRVTSGAASARCARTIVAEAPTSDFTLNVSRAGAGAGTVSGPGIDCGTDCTQIYGPGAVVSLSPASAAGSHFAGWSGDCSGTGPCVITMDAPRHVVATFAPDPTLQVTLGGAGAGTVSGPGISCGPDCSETYPPGTVVTLTATAQTGSTFAGWGGACSGTGSCVFTMNGAVDVTANFDVAMVTLTVVTNGDAAPFVNVVGQGISCGTDCSESYPYGTRVTLTVVPQPGAPPFTFPGWIGVGCSGTGPCQLTLTNPVTMLAVFIRLFNVSVSVTGSGAGRVVSADGNIDCPGACSHAYASSAPPVRLMAVPTAPSCFNSWLGDCAPQNPVPQCELTPNADHATTAIFNAVCISATGRAAGAGAASLDWASDLQSRDAAGRVFGNGSDAGVALAGVTRLAIPKRAGVSRVEAQLQVGADRGGTWRFELLDRGTLEPGSLRLLEGEAVQVTDEAIVFRIAGRVGERVAFTFRTKGP